MFYSPQYRERKESDSASRFSTSENELEKIFLQTPMKYVMYKCTVHV